MSGRGCWLWDGRFGSLGFARDGVKRLGYETEDGYGMVNSGSYAGEASGGAGGGDWGLEDVFRWVLDRCGGAQAAYLVSTDWVCVGQKDGAFRTYRVGDNGVCTRPIGRKMAGQRRVGGVIVAPRQVSRQLYLSGGVFCGKIRCVQLGLS